MIVSDPKRQAGFVEAVALKLAEDPRFLERLKKTREGP
jgi:hypothetical protein